MFIYKLMFILSIIIIIAMIRMYYLNDFYGGNLSRIEKRHPIEWWLLPAVIIISFITNLTLLLYS